MVGQQIDDRKWYGRFDKQEILKRTNGICACCGKKLTVKTMTIEHVIPISRGGYDGPANTIPLCEQCNKDKGNMLYIPIWFYTAIAGTKLSYELNEMFQKWFRTVKQDFDITLFPLIAPRNNLLLQVGSNCSRLDQRFMNKKKMYIRSNVIQWHYTGKEYMDEVSAITDVDLRALRHTIKSLTPELDPPVALYTCRKLTSDKILCLAAISMDLAEKRAIICIEWSELPKTYRPIIYNSIIRMLFNVMEIGDYDLTDVIFMVHEDDEFAINEIESDGLQFVAADAMKQGLELRHRKFRISKADDEDMRYACLQIHKGPLEPKDYVVPI